MFAALGVFAGGFTDEFSRTVAGGDPLPLVERSLVRRADGRFTLLEPIRAYAVERLRKAGGEGDARDRASRCVPRLLAEAANERIFAGTDAESAYNALDVELDNLRAAIDWAVECGRSAEEVALAVALRQFWIVRGHIAEGRRRFESAVAHTADSAGALRASALTHGASFAYRQGELATAKAWWEEALALYRETGEAPEIGRCLGELGSVALGEGDIEGAQALYEESVELFERENVPQRLAIVLANLGAIATMRGELDVAAAYAERAAEIQRDLGDRDGLSITSHNYARILASLGRLEEAEAALRESVEIARSLDYREVLAYCLETSGELAFEQSDYERAAFLLGASVAAFEKLEVAMAAEEADGYARVLEALRAELGATGSTSCTRRVARRRSRSRSARQLA